MERPRSSKNMVINFSKKEMYKTFITTLAFSLFILTPIVLPFLEALMVALFWYDFLAFCHILLNFSNRHKTMAFEPNLESQIQPVWVTWNWCLHQQLLHCDGGVKSRSVMIHNATVSSIFWPFQNALNQCVGDTHFVYPFNNYTLIWCYDYANLDHIFIGSSQFRAAAALISY